MIITFCGHSKIDEFEKLELWLYDVVERLAENADTTFYLGGYGDFDLLAKRVVWSLKSKYPNIKSTLVIPYLNRKYDTNNYDDTLYPPLENVPLKFAISKRNEWMIEQSDVLIAYVKNNFGGASKTLNFAKRKNKKIYLYPSLKK